MAAPEGKRCAAAAAVVSSPPPPPPASAPFPPPRPRLPVTLLCELRRGRGGSAGGPVILRTHRARRPSGVAPAGSAGPPLGGGERRPEAPRRARSGRPPVSQAPAKRGGSCPGLGNAPKRPGLVLLGRAVRNARVWLQSPGAPLEQAGWDRWEGRGKELPRVRAHAVAELSGDSPAFGGSCPYRRFVPSPYCTWEVLGGCCSRVYFSASPQGHLRPIQAERTGP